MPKAINSPALLHIGASKTATTTLQLNVFSNVSEIFFIGKPYSHLKDMQIQKLQNVDLEVITRTINGITRLTNEDELNQGLDYVRQVTEEILGSSAERIVLSEEALCNNKVVPFVSIAGRLHRAFGVADILLTVRSQFSALPSLYLHEMKKSKKRESFDRWLKDALEDPRATCRQGASVEQYRYHSVLSGFREKLSGRISVMLYEDLIFNRMRFASQLAELIGVSEDRIASLLDHAPKNVGKSENWFRYQDLLAQYAKIVTMLPPSLERLRALPPLRWVKDAVKARLQAKADSAPPTKVEISAESRERIIEYYADDNRRLAETYSLNLGEFAYPGFE